MYILCGLFRIGLTNNNVHSQYLNPDARASMPTILYSSLLCYTMRLFLCQNTRYVVQAVMLSEDTGGQSALMDRDRKSVV